MNRVFRLLAPIFRFAGLFALGLIANVGLSSLTWAAPREPVPETESEPGETDGTPVRMSAAQIQRTVMDFSDRYVSALWVALDQYIQNEPDVSKKVKAQRYKVMLGSTAMTIAASRDPRSGLLDMAVFISAGKWATNRYWIPEVFGEGAASLRTVYTEMDREIWAEVSRMLTSAQESDLRRLIKGWTANDPDRVEVLDVRLRNLDGVELKNFSEASSARGLLASVRRLLGSVDQSLLYGERVIFYMERMPRILALQSDLTIDRVAERFPIATVNPDFSGLPELAKDLPDRIEKMISTRENFVRETLPELRGSLESFERTTLSLQQSLESVNALSARIEKMPFEQQDYSVAFQNFSGSLTQVQGVVDGLNRLIDTSLAPDGQLRAAQLVQALDERAEYWMNGVFYRALILLAVFFAGLLLLLVAARVLFRRTKSVPN